MLNRMLYLLQVVSQQSSLLAPIAVEAVLKVIDPAKDRNVDLKVCCFVLIRSGDSYFWNTELE